MRAKPRIGVGLDFMGGHGRGVLKGIAAYAHLARWELATNPFWALGRVDNPTIPGGRLDGVIASLHNQGLRGRVLARGIPTVNVSSNAASSRCPSVVTDNFAIAQLALSHLRSLGLRCFAYVGVKDNTVWSYERGKAFLDGIVQHGLEAHSWRMAQVEGVTSGRAGTLEAWLRTLPKPIAVFAGNDGAASDLLKACQRIALQVPEQLAVVGVDNDELINSLAIPSLTSVDPNAYAVGYRASQMLDGLLHGEAPPTEPLYVAPLGIVARLSSQNLARNDAEVAQAVRFIREHAAEPMNVEDVLEVVPLSRRPLERRFARSLGYSILDAIHRAKIERAQRLLVESDLSLAGVARACGLVSQTRLTIIFRNVTGSTPGQYRKRNASPGVKLEALPQHIAPSIS